MKQYYLLPFILLAISCSNERTSSVTTTDEVVQSKYAAGEAVYQKNCVACHQSEGEGVIGVFPPLAGSDYLLADKNRSIKQIIHGSNEEMIVNGETYNTIMPPQPLTDEEVRDVVNFILNAWGNSGGEVTIEEVKAQR